MRAYCVADGRDVSDRYYRIVLLIYCIHGIYGMYTVTLQHSLIQSLNPLGFESICSDPPYSILSTAIAIPARPRVLHFYVVDFSWQRHVGSNTDYFARDALLLTSSYLPYVIRTLVSSSLFGCHGHDDVWRHYSTATVQQCDEVGGRESVSVTAL